MRMDINHGHKLEFIVADNFYKHPLEVRNKALNTSYQKNKDYFKGARSVEQFRSYEIKHQFEEIMGKKIVKWDHESNGKFQFCIPEDPIVYHMDSQTYAAIVYLTPDAPPDTGTSFFRAKGSPWRRNPGDEMTWNEDDLKREIDIIFRGGFLDGSNFELIDQIGNVFNRLVIWDAHMIHAATRYFGTTQNNSRLFQIFFFDVEK